MYNKIFEFEKDLLGNINFRIFVFLHEKKTKKQFSEKYS